MSQGDCAMKLSQMHDVKDSSLLIQLIHLSIMSELIIVE